MAQNLVRRWVPSDRLGERPVSIFDASWQGGQQRLILTLKYADGRGDDEDAVIIFHDVYAYRIFDENMDDDSLLDSQAAQLAVNYPYGGRWPFLEITSSTWVHELVERDGAWATGDFRHLIVTARQMHLHVACRTLVQPDYITNES
jgi:hypothetical protein